MAAGRLRSADADEIVQNGQVDDTSWDRVRPLLEQEQQRERERFDRQISTGTPELRTERFEDLGIGPGGSDYTGYLYELTIGDRVFGLRRYDDEPDLISFMDTGRSGEEPGPIRGGVPYRNRMFAEAVAYLVDRLGVSRVDVFTSDPEHPGVAYVPVDLSRLEP